MYLLFLFGVEDIYIVCIIGDEYRVECLFNIGVNVNFFD